MSIRKASLRIAAIGIVMFYIISPPVLFSADKINETREKVIYQTGFEEGTREHPGEWERIAAPGTEVSTPGREGIGRALQITTFPENKNPQWISPFIQTTSGLVCISGWMAPIFWESLTTDYRGQLEIACYNDKNEEIAVLSETGAYVWGVDNYCGEWPITDKWRKWRYVESHPLQIPSGTSSVRILFRFNQNYAARTKGMIWLDDVQLSTTQPEDTTAKALDKLSSWRLMVNTPVAANIFWPGDPLEFSLCVYYDDHWQKQKALNSFETAAVSKIRWEVRDLYSGLIDRGELPYAEPFARISLSDNTNSPNHSLIMKTVLLPADLHNYPESFLRAKFALLDINGHELLAEETFFTIHRYIPVTREKAKQSRVSVFQYGAGVQKCTSWGQERPFDMLQLGYNWSHCGLAGRWKDVQPQEGGPINWDKDDPLKFITDNIMKGGNILDTSLHLYAVLWCSRQKYATPAWMHDATDPNLDKILPAKMAQVAEAIAKRCQTVVSAYGFGWEEPMDQDRAARAIACGPAIKQGDSNVLVDVTFNNGGFDAAKLDTVNKYNLLEYGDVVVTHYGDPLAQRPYTLELKKMMANKGRNQQLWNTEYNTHMLAAQPYKEAAKSVLRDFSRGFASGYDKIWWISYAWFPAYGVDQAIYDNWDLAKENGFGVRAQWGQKVANSLGKTSDRLRYCLSPVGVAVMNVARILDYWNKVDILAVGPKIEGYLFHREKDDAMTLWREEGAGPAVLLVRCPVPYEITDITGRRGIIEPLNGLSVISIDENPTYLLFQGKAPDLIIEPIGGYLRALQPKVPLGKPAKIEFTLPNIFGTAFQGQIKFQADPSFQINPAHILLAGQASKIWRENLTVTPPADWKNGDEMPILAWIITADNKVVGLMKSTLALTPIIEATLFPVPWTPEKSAGVGVRVANHGDNEVTYRIGCRVPYGRAMRPPKFEKTCQIPPNSIREIVFPITGKPCLNERYPVSVVLRDDKTEKLVSSRLGFIASRKSKKPITIDGDLSDWDLSNPIELGSYSGLGQFPGDKEFWKGLQDCSGNCYTTWDDKYFYVAVKVIDDEHLNATHGKPIWAGDEVQLGIQTWSVNAGLDHYIGDMIGMTDLYGPSMIRSLTTLPGQSGRILDAKIGFMRDEKTRTTTYEIRYPHNRIAFGGFKFQEGQTMLFHLLVFDDDTWNSRAASGTKGLNDWISMMGKMVSPGYSLGDAEKDFGMLTLVE